MAQIIESDSYPAIRMAIDSTLNATQLSDELIGMDIYHGASEREVKKRVSTWASATGDDLLRLKAAVIFLTAARLCYVVTRVTSLSVQARDVSYSKAIFKPEERAEYLRRMAEDELSEVLEPSETDSNRPEMFRRISGTRGK